MDPRKLLTAAKAVQVAIPQTKEIWFHGSRATGKARADSDYDILLVVPDEIVDSTEPLI